jgi:maleylpyruvate isomerase
MEDLRDALSQETGRLLTTIGQLPPESLGWPSRCAGWTRGHVLAHIARNADAIGNLVTWAVTGERHDMYASPEARAADIEAGAHRSMPEQYDDVSSSAARLAELLDQLKPEHARTKVEMRGGRRVRAGRLAEVRLREVVFHHVDLDSGYTFADTDPEVVRLLLEDAIRRVAADPEIPPLRLGTDRGESWVTGADPTYVVGDRAGLLMWLARGVTDGVYTDTELPTLPSGG